MSDQEKLALAMKVSLQEVALRRAAAQITDLEAQLALTKMLYAKDLRDITVALSDEYLDDAFTIINRRLNDAGTEIDITNDDVLDAIRNFDSKTGSAAPKGIDSGFGEGGN